MQRCPGTVPGVGFAVVNQTEVVPTLKDLAVELGRWLVIGQREQCLGSLRVAPDPAWRSQQRA